MNNRFKIYTSIPADAASYKARSRDALLASTGLPFWVYPPMGYNTDS